MAGYTEEQHEQSQAATPATVGAVSTSGSQPQSEQPAVSTDTEHETPAVSPEQQQRVDATAGTDRQIKTIQDWMDAEGNRPETEEERKKRERREKSKRIIAAVSDGISALSNLYFTSQYAPDMYNHEKGSMTNAVDARLERLKAEREKNADKYLQFSLKLGDLENERAKTLRELEAQQERQKLAREKAQREAEAHGWRLFCNLTNSVSRQARPTEPSRKLSQRKQKPRQHPNSSRLKSPPKKREKAVWTLRPPTLAPLRPHTDAPIKMSSLHGMSMATSISFAQKKPQKPMPNNTAHGKKRTKRKQRQPKQGARPNPSLKSVHRPRPRKAVMQANPAPPADNLQPHNHNPLWQKIK